MKLDNTDKKLLNIVQAEFPLSREPFSALGRRLDLSSDEVIRRTERLKAEGIIRLIGPVFNAGRLGYQTTLVGMKVAAEQLDEAAQIISAHPRVSHCYERNHDFNFWFTLAMRTEEDIETELHKLGDRIKANATLNLPAVRVFKIGAYFNIGGGDSLVPNSGVDSTGVLSNDVDLSPTDRAVVNELQQDLPLTAAPFDLMSAHLSMGVDKFLSDSQGLIHRGVIRRFSASVSHNMLGFVANAMACWKVPADMVETAGREMATVQEISHCYERKASPLWPYNLYAMMHAHTKEGCQSIADKLSSDTGLDKNASVLLFTTREVKKTRVRYPV
ncbi:MAG: Lrp/AsnC family transcriptional regulator [Dehalococcoidia bacterium]|nr:Lrp/AsnC family transcriptional regulator [Dehalococcoidia bacterium]